MKRHKILFIGRFTQESLHMKNMLALYPQFHVEWVRDAAHAIVGLSGEDKPELTLINSDIFNNSKLTLSKQIRQFSPNSKILFICDGGAKPLENQIRRIPGLTVLTRPVTEREIIGVIKKVVIGQKVQPRLFPRYETDQETNIQFWNSGEKVSGHLTELSVGGARLDVRNSKIKSGDVLKFKVPLNNLQKHHEVNAKVIWAKPFDPITASISIGVRFIKAVEIYQTLLQRS